MIWDRAFWKNRIPDVQFIFSDCFIPTWWTQYPIDLPMLTGWLGGPKQPGLLMNLILFSSTKQLKVWLQERLWEYGRANRPTAFPNAAEVKDELRTGN
jgi:hypothetical protein